MLLHSEPGAEPAHAPSVSVVIPLYNKRAYVERALGSVLAQRDVALEVIVVDDGSTDGSAEAVASCTDPRVRLIRQPNQGPGAARNTGWRAAAGPCVAFLDADDHWAPDYLTNSLQRLDADPEAAAVSLGFLEETDRGVVDPGPGALLASGVQWGRFAVTADTPPLRVVRVLEFMFSQSTVVRRAVLERFGGFFALERCTYGEDTFLWLQVLLNHPVRLEYLPRVTIDRTGSDLSTLATLATRSIEPMLTHPGLLEARCPPPLRPLLSRFLSLKAVKRACVLAAVGRWREGRALVDRFGRDGARWTAYGLASLVFLNPVGALGARAAVGVLRRVRPH